MADAHGTTIASETAVAMASARVDTLSSASHSPSHFAAPRFQGRAPVHPGDDHGLVCGSGSNAL